MLQRLQRRLQGERESGFTLIELMVVVLIIAILIAIAIPTFLGARQRAQDRAAQSNLRNGLTAEKTNYTDTQAYTNVVATLQGIERSIQWGGNVAPATLGWVYVNVSTTNAATPNDTVVVGALSASGSCFYIRDIATGATAGTTYGRSAASPCPTPGAFGAPGRRTGSPIPHGRRGGHLAAPPPVVDGRDRRERQPVRFAPMSPLSAALLAGLIGLAAGSFANVVIYRVPRHESVTRPGSHCPACGSPVAWHDNLPLLGWLVLRGRCRSCQAPIPVRYPLVELGMGLLWFVVTLRLAASGLGWAIPAYLALAFICLLLAVIDATTRLLPNRITYPAFPVVLGLLLVASVGLGDLGRLARGLLAAVAVGAFFLLLALISPRGMGLGDVKLAPTLGLALGWLSWGAVAVGVFAGFLLGGLAGLAAILLLGLTRKSLLPFGPWLVTGALLGVLAGADVAAWYARGLLGS